MTPSTLVGLGIDVLALFALVGWLYRRRAAAPEMTMVFVTLNIGLLVGVLMRFSEGGQAVWS